MVFRQQEGMYPIIAYFFLFPVNCAQKIEFKQFTYYFDLHQSRYAETDGSLLLLHFVTLSHYVTVSLLVVKYRMPEFSSDPTVCTQKTAAFPTSCVKTHAFMQLRVLE